VSHQPEHAAVLTRLPGGHEYSRCSFSGAGNCCCGRPVESQLHPHIFTPMRVDPMRCVCLKPPNWHGHRSPTPDQP
jgi:hypothetical protein